MSITIEMNHEAGYFVSHYIGVITDADLLKDWKSIFKSGVWIPDLNELADLSEADLNSLTYDGIKTLAYYFNNMATENNITFMKKTAINAPYALNFGLSRMYSVFAYDSSQYIEVFREREKAIQWLRNEK